MNVSDGGERRAEGRERRGNRVIDEWGSSR